MIEPNVTQPRFWIFQATPERYNLEQKLKSLKKDTWTAGQYGKHINQGDVIFFLQSGNNSALYGWGNALEYETIKSGLNVMVEYQEAFVTPVPLAGLASDPVLQYISRLRFSQGTIFKLTSLEGNALQQYIISQGSRGPGVELPEVIPLKNMLEYSLSRSPSKILNGALQLSYDILDVPEIQTAFIKLLEERIGNPNKREDTTTFLLRYINEDALSGLVAQRITGISSVPVMEKQSINPPELDGKTSQVYLNVMHMLQKAKEYAIRTTRSERIFSRHLMASLWENTDLEPILVELGVKPEQFKKDLLNYMPKRYDKDNYSQWKEILLGTSNDTTFQQFIARLNSDDAEGEDLLNIKQDVESLASVITSKDIGPPLAIGLFGDWGSGKTFFMKKLRSRIGFLSENSRKNPTVKTTYCKNVISIWFNAWHYLDSNLWASLIDHIFNCLEQYILQRQEEALKLNQQFTDPLMQLATIQQLKSEADEKKKAIALKKEELIGKRDETANKKLEIETQAKRVLSKNGLENILNGEVINKAKELIGKLGQLHSEWTGENDAFKEKLSKLGDNISKDHAKLSDLQPIISEATQLAGSSKQIWHRLLVNLSYWKLIVLFTVVLGLSILGVVYFKDGFVTFFAQLISVAGLLIAFLKNQLNLANGLMDITHGLREESKLILELNEQDREKEILYLNQELNRLNDSIISTEEQLNKVEEESKSLEEIEMKLTSARRLVNFINSRARSEDYSRHLGLISMVRKDFEELTKLMYPPEEENNPDYTPPIERIVLYIDDLDRCSEVKVMEVLQAVHLLLAFRLFVVVVGVDARWVSRSIKQVYPHLLNEWEREEHTDPKSDHAPLKNTASTQDYLEKIFQIPFWLKAVDNPDLVSSLIKGTLKSIEKATTDAGEKGTLDTGDGKTDAVQEYVSEEVSYEEFDPNPEFLLLNQNELEFMSSLGPIAGMSPRAIKRYLNLYRLIKGTYQDMQLPTFNELGGGYSEVQLILALQSGHALLYHDLLELMKENPKTKFKTFIQNIHDKKVDREWDDLIEKLKAMSIKNSISIEKILNYHPRISRYSFHYQKR